MSSYSRDDLRDVRRGSSRDSADEDGEEGAYFVDSAGESENHSDESDAEGDFDKDGHQDEIDEEDEWDDDLDDDEEPSAEEIAIREQLERERAELLAQLEALRAGHSAQAPPIQPESRNAKDDISSVVDDDWGDDEIYESDDDMDRSQDECTDPLHNGANGEDISRSWTLYIYHLGYRVVACILRLVVLLLWFLLVLFVDFLIFPVSYVRNSMVNSVRNRSTEKNARLSVMQEFFGPKGHVGIFPRPHVVLALVMGTALACFICTVTEDEFLFGPRDPTQDIHTAMYEDNIVLPIEISFDRVGCQVSDHLYPILHNITGHLPAGQITGVLGPSGAGKSTLAYQLLGRGDRLCDRALGDVYLNGERQSLNVILDRVGYVPQKDALIEELTVEESLLHSASWRLPWYYTEAQRKEALEETLSLLDLHHIRHERIGGLVNRGLSGGEKKRVSIGLELITNPSVLVMDEPTSGLDGAAAFKLARRLRKIVDKKGVSIVIVLHVPSTRVFELLDNLVLLQQGQAVYVGPRKDVVRAFSVMGFDVAPRAEETRMTTPEYLLDVLAGSVPYPPNMCPYADMVADRFKLDASNKSWHDYSVSFDYMSTEGKGKDETRCGDRPTLPMIWRSLVESDESTAFYGRSSPAMQVTSQEDCEQFGAVRKRICKREYILHNYPRVPKPGLVRQAYLWVDVLARTAVRQGFVIEVMSTLITAMVCAWVRSYSGSWDARALAAFFVSVGVAALAAFSAVFQDNVPPIKRAAQAGMVLGAHHNAMVAFNVFKAFFTANIFALMFHITLLIRTGDFRLFRLRRHIEMTYLVLVGHIASWAAAALLCVLSGHHFQSSCVLVIGYLLWTHVFAMYTPNKRQIDLDSLLLDEYDAKRFIQMQCSMSPARYFMEAFTVWDSIPSNAAKENAASRNFMLNYFSYRDENLSGCCSTLVIFFLTLVIIRWWVFGYWNSTDFHKLFDQPLFAKFSLKVYFSFSLSSAILLTIFSEVKRYRRRARARSASLPASSDEIEQF